MPPSLINQSGIGLGDYVQTFRHGHRGRVLAVHLLGCPESKEWFRAQKPPLDASLYDVGVWFGVLLADDKGSVTVPAVDAELVSAFDLNTPGEEEYWPRR